MNDHLTVTDIFGWFVCIQDGLIRFLAKYLPQRVIHMPFWFWKSPLMLQGELDSTLCIKVCLWLATGQWFSKVCLWLATGQWFSKVCLWLATGQRFSKVCLWLATGQWFSQVCLWLATGQRFSKIFSTNKTDCHDITEILLKVALHTYNLT